MAYHKRPLTTRSCSHCHRAYQAVDRRRLYCSSSCKVLACQHRRRELAFAKQQQTDTDSSLQGTSTPAVNAAPAATSSTPHEVTLATNWQNGLMLGGTALAVDGLKEVVKFVGKLLAPAPQAGPATWLPLELRGHKAPLVLFEHPSWEEPRFFVPVPYEGTVFFYRQAHNLLFWQDAQGQWHQLSTAAEFEHIARHFRLAKIMQQQGYFFDSTRLSLSAARQLKDQG
jgi:hypothetical protein